MVMVSGAAHDTMCVAATRPERDGLRPVPRRVSHHPAESASADDAALAAEIMLASIASLRRRPR